MIADRIPVDSAEAHELAEQRQAMALEAQRRAAEHATTCRNGWLGDDDQGRPIPCRQCRPHLANLPCRTCGVVAHACTTQATRRRGACCDACDHTIRRSS